MTEASSNNKRGRPPAGKRKIIKRKPGSTTPTKNYFDGTTQDAIVDFQKEENVELRKKIYEDRIEGAFSALVENLINVYGFQVQYDTKTDLKNECISFLYTVIMKFDHTKGSKAFSYFNVVAKNWLTIKSKQNAHNMQILLSMDNKDMFTNHELELIENYQIVPSADEHVSHEEHTENIKKMLAVLKDRVKTDNEMACIEAIITLFNSAEDLDIINKRAAMLYIREITSLSPKQLSVILSTLKKHYKSVKEEEISS